MMAMANFTVISATLENDREQSSLLQQGRPRSGTPDHHINHHNSTSDEVQHDNNSEMVTINVGGKRFETYRDSLEQYPTTLMGNRTSFDRYFNPKKNEYFLDRNQMSFPAILHFYQSDGTVYIPNTVPREIHFEELEFYRIPFRQAYTPAASSVNKNHLVSEDNSKWQAIRWRIWEFLECPDSSIYARVWALLDVFIILVSILCVILESTPELRGEEYLRVFGIIDTICVAFFTFDFCIRLILCPSLLDFAKVPLNILDCLAIMPFYLELAIGRLVKGSALTTFKVLRIFRIMRVMKLIRHSKRLILMGRVIRDCLSELTLLLIIWLMGVLTFGTVMYYIESEKNDSGFDSILHSCWWAVVSISTVGYGDMYPRTGLGKLIGSCLLFISMVYLALPMTVIVSKFNKAFERFREDEQLALDQRQAHRAVCRPSSTTKPAADAIEP